ncbi:MAG: ABC transporter ATP-binding protein [Actinomycetota bacterium]|nr:ABC transporter ATP-binding protein [Actinomycetota bacterium]
MILLTLAGILAGTLTAPRILGFATDTVVAGVTGDARGVDFGVLGGYAATLIGLYAITFVCSYAQERLAAQVVRQVVFDLRESIAVKLSRMPLRYFDAEPAAEMQSRLTNDIDHLQQALQQITGQLIAKVTVIVGAGAMMVVISPLLALVVLATLPLSGLFAATVARRADRRFGERSAATGRLVAHAEESYAGHQVIASLGTGQAAAVFDARNTEMYEAGLRGQVAAGTIEPATQLIANASYILIAVIGAFRVMGGALTIGDLQAFTQYSGHFGSNAGMLGGMIGELQSGMASARRIYQLLDEPEESPDPSGAGGADSAREIRGHVAFDRVGFRYTADRPLIEDLSFTIESGTTVAVVGPTGAGKTTLAALLMRFYEPDRGRILLDGADIAELPRSAVRAVTGLVQQRTWLFEGTIADNIAYGRAGATRADVVAAAKATRVDQMIRTLPHGYDTVLGEAAAISEGERQLITVARAYIADPAVLILDEATSSVDTRTEVLLQKAMRELRAGRTCLVIAHRLSTIRDADQIIVLDRGRIVERGTHDALLAAGGAYAGQYTSTLGF